MSARRQRQLNGLAAIDRAATVPPPGAPDSMRSATSGPGTNRGSPAEAARKPQRRLPKAEPATDPADSGKHRRAVTVPTQVVEQLRQRAQELDRFQTDLILDCLAATSAALERELDAVEVPSNTPFHRPRRRAHRGRTVTTLTLYLTHDEVQAMDALARRLGLSRSAVIASALDRALGQLS